MSSVTLCNSDFLMVVHSLCYRSCWILMMNLCRKFGLVSQPLKTKASQRNYCKVALVPALITFNSFKNSLDNHWSNRDIIYNWHSELSDAETEVLVSVDLK